MGPTKKPWWLRCNQQKKTLPQGRVFFVPQVLLTMKYHFLAGKRSNFATMKSEIRLCPVCKKSYLVMASRWPHSRPTAKVLRPKVSVGAKRRAVSSSQQFCLACSAPALNQRCKKCNQMYTHSCSRACQPLVHHYTCSAVLELRHETGKGAGLFAREAFAVGQGSSGAWVGAWVDRWISG